MHTRSSDRSSTYGPPPNSDEIDRLYKDLRNLERKSTIAQSQVQPSGRRGAIGPDGIFGESLLSRGRSDRARKEHMKTNIKSKLKPDLKMSEAFKLISKIEDGLLMEQMDNNAPLHDKD